MDGAIFPFLLYLVTSEIAILPFQKYEIPHLTLKSLLTRNYKIDNNYFLGLIEVFRPGLLILLRLDYKQYTYHKWTKYYSDLHNKEKIAIHIKIFILSALSSVFTMFLYTSFLNSYLAYYVLFLTIILILSMLALLRKSR